MRRKGAYLGDVVKVLRQLIVCAVIGSGAVCFGQGVQSVSHAVGGSTGGAPDGGMPMVVQLRTDQVGAARQQAMDLLRLKIESDQISPSYTVGSFLERAGRKDTLITVLGGADQIGGARWLDEQTCQVRLEIGGGKVASAIEQVAAESPTAPISQRGMIARLQSWSSRTFSATGTSTVAAALQGIRPMQLSGAWAAVDAQTRQRAVAMARENAVQQCLSSVSPIQLTAGRMVGDALAVEVVRQRMADWFAARPVTEVEFRDDREVEVSLSAQPGEVFDAFAAALVAWDGAPRWTEAERAAVKSAFLARMVRPVGRAVAPAPATPATVSSIALPTVPPVWVNDQLDAEGTGPVASSRLRAARMAEGVATGTLRAKVEALPLSGAMTIGDAAKADGQIRGAVDRVVGRAHLYRAEYRPDGSVTVRVSVELRDLWIELHGGE